jgi:hypothetical protein
LRFFCSTWEKSASYEAQSGDLKGAAALPLGSMTAFQKRVFPLRVNSHHSNKSGSGGRICRLSAGAAEIDDFALILRRSKSRDRQSIPASGIDYRQVAAEFSLLATTIPGRVPPANRPWVMAPVPIIAIEKAVPGRPTQAPQPSRLRMRSLYLVGCCVATYVFTAGTPRASRSANSLSIKSI